MTQGVYTFAGIQHPKEASYTQSHGTEPGRILLTFTAQAATIAAGGTVTFTYEGSSIVLPDCMVDQGQFEFHPNGFIERAILYDRRWKWRRYAKESVVWNERMPSGETIRTPTELTPQQILTTLFTLIGESNVDVSAVPNASRPEVIANCEDVVDIIERVVGTLGCRIILGYGTDAVSVVPVNHGTALPDDTGIGRLSVSYNPPEIPRYVRVQFRPTIYQSRFFLEPVGLDTDGQVKPIDSLSYTPAGGWAAWANVDTFAGLGSAAVESLARQSVFRWFRITDTPSIQGYGGAAIADRYRVLPLKGSRAEFATVGNSSQRLAARVWGEVWVDDDKEKDLSGPSSGTNTARSIELPFRFAVDGVNGMVRFGREVRKLVGGQNADPNLVLEIAHNVRNTVSFAKDAYYYEAEVDPTGVGVETICDANQRIVIGQYSTTHSGTGSTNNESELDTYADAVIADYLTSLLAYEQYVAQYNTLRVDIKPTGKIHQVTHMVSDTSGAVTVGSQHMEWDTGTFTRKEVRRKQNIDRTTEQVTTSTASRLKEEIRGENSMS